MGVALRLRRLERRDFWDGAAVTATHDGWTTPGDLLERLYPLLAGGLTWIHAVRYEIPGGAGTARNYYTVDLDDSISLGPAAFSQSTI